MNGVTILKQLYTNNSQIISNKKRSVLSFYDKDDEKYLIDNSTFELLLHEKYIKLTDKIEEDDIFLYDITEQGIKFYKSILD